MGREQQFGDCPCSGKNLPRLLQPVIMALLARETMHGYRLLELLAEEPVFRGQKPDQTGVYRLLRKMEKEGLVDCQWDLGNCGAARRLYALNERGLACLDRWRQTLLDYHAAVGMVVARINQARGPFSVLTHSDTDRPAAAASSTTRR